MSVEIPIDTIKSFISILEQSCLLYKKDESIPDRCEEPSLEEMTIEKAKDIVKQSGCIIKEPKVKKIPMTKEEKNAKALERYHNGGDVIRERQRQYAIKRKEKAYIKEHGSLDGFNRKEYTTAYSKNRK